MEGLRPGTVLRGKYEVHGRIAEGGTSLLYEAHLVCGAGRVAIKQLQAAASTDPDDFALFEKEYRVLRALRHPGLAHVLDFFEEGGHYYLVEEFVPGQSLLDRLDEKGRMPFEEAMGLLRELLDILAYLHGHGLIYRDLKPSNIILQPDGRVRLVDFGAIRRYKPGASRDTIPLGTPGYAAPEQYGRAQSDARSDLFAAGVLLHQLLTGTPPPLAGSLQHPSDSATDVPRPVGDLVMKATSEKPADRFQSAAQMDQALRSLERRECGLCDAWVPAGVAEKYCPACKPWARRRAQLAMLLGLLGFVVLGAALLLDLPMPGVTRCNSAGPCTLCRHNLRLIAHSLDLYADDFGRLPPSLECLVPKYLPQIPACPSARRDTYSQGYVRPSQGLEYTVFCRGLNHSAARQGENFPQYNSREMRLIP